MRLQGEKTSSPGLRQVLVILQGTGWHSQPSLLPLMAESKSSVVWLRVAVKWEVPCSCITIINGSCQNVPENTSIQKGKEKSVVPQLDFIRSYWTGERNRTRSLPDFNFLWQIMMGADVCYPVWLKRVALGCLSVRQWRVESSACSVRCPAHSGVQGCAWPLGNCGGSITADCGGSMVCAVLHLPCLVWHSCSWGSHASPSTVTFGGTPQTNLCLEHPADVGELSANLKLLTQTLISARDQRVLVGIMMRKVLWATSWSQILKSYWGCN